MTTKSKVIKEIKSIILIVVVVFAFRSVFFEPFRIPSGSMIPTLHIGDFILVNKFSYGFKVPFSEWMDKSIYITPFTGPKRGDVVVFKYPRDPSLNYIKRVVGIPGDKIQVYEKKVYVNGLELTKEVIGEDVTGKYYEDMVEEYRTKTFKFFYETNNEVTYPTQLTEMPAKLDNFEETVVPEKHYFVMGDNRDFSADSRDWGFVPEENIKGKAMFVWFSLSLPLGDYEFKFRPHRIGTMIK